MAILKKANKPKVEEEEEIPMKFHIDQNVMFTDDGTDYHGVVIDIDQKKEIATVKVDEDSYEVPYDDLKEQVAKPSKSKPTAVKKEKVKGKGDDFSKIFNNTAAASTGGVGLPPGKHKAVVIEISLRDGDKGLSGMIKYQVYDEDDEANEKSGVSFYQLINSEGEEQEGFGFFKRELILFGMDEDMTINTRAELEDECERLSKKELYVEINVREKGGYTNIFLNEVLDQDEKP